jgi:hypothetical protein
MNSNLVSWATRNAVSHQALAELQAIFRLNGAEKMDVVSVGNSEAAVQAQIRLEAARKGLRLWRNNVGVLKDERGVPVRYGLGNDSKQLNAVIKSGDLIGWRPVLITPEMVGSTIAQFVSRECKRVGWSYKGDEHERAQLKWAEIIVADGGDACFASGEGTL